MGGMLLRSIKLRQKGATLTLPIYLGTTSKVLLSKQKLQECFFHLINRHNLHLSVFKTGPVSRLTFKRSTPLSVRVNPRQSRKKKSFARKLTIN